MSKIDVILPTYNQELFLDISIPAILNQEFKDFTFIIVNDGSKDNTIAKLMAYASCDNRIKVIDCEINRGLPAALNIGHEAGNSEYCTWISTDNISYPNYLLELYKKIEEGFDFVQSFYFVKDKSGKKSFRDIRTFHDNWGYGNLTPSFLYKRGVWETYKYDENLQYVEDLKFYLQAFLHPFKFGFVEKTLVEYLCHSDSMTAKVHANLKEHDLRLNKIYEQVIKPHK